MILLRSMNLFYDLIRATTSNKLWSKLSKVVFDSTVNKACLNIYKKHRWQENCLKNSPFKYKVIKKQIFDQQDSIKLKPQETHSSRFDDSPVNKPKNFFKSKTKHFYFIF